METTRNPFCFIKCVVSEMFEAVADLLGSKPVKKEKRKDLKKPPIKKKKKVQSEFIGNLIIKTLLVFGKEIPRIVKRKAKEVFSSVWVRFVCFFRLQNTDIVGTIKEAAKKSGKDMLYSLLMSFLLFIGGIFDRHAKAEFEHKRNHQYQNQQHNRQQHSSKPRPNTYVYDSTLAEEMSFYDGSQNAYQDVNGAIFPQERPPGL